MRRRIKRHLAAKAEQLRRFLDWRNARHLHPSVYFFTFHKCASSLFGSHFLGSIEGRRHVDYEEMIYAGNPKARYAFEPYGYAYGPLRISHLSLTDAHDRFRRQVFREDFVAGRTAIFLIRDPRDIIVSSYYSFGYSHELSVSPEVRTGQLEVREMIQSMTLDEFAAYYADIMLDRFALARNLSEACSAATVLRYEDMILDWDSFAADLSRAAPIPQATLDDIHLRSRPRDVENVDSHRRSGMPGGFRDKLAPETVARLNAILDGPLSYFGYET